MDAMEDLVINASSTQDSLGSTRSTSSFSWPFSGILAGSSSMKNSPEKKGKRPSFMINKNKNKPNPSDPNRAPSVDETFSVDRFRHDIEQAKTMRRDMDKRKQQQREQEEQRKRTEAEIRSGLNGLDEAIVLRKKGRIKDALDISEKSIELLIGYLKSEPSSIEIPGLSRNVVAVRIQNALTLAEGMKSELNKKSTVRPSKRQPQTRKSIGTSIKQKLDAAKEKVPLSSPKAQPAKKTSSSPKARPAKNTTKNTTMNSTKNTTTTTTRGKLASGGHLSNNVPRRSSLTVERLHCSNGKSCANRSAGANPYANRYAGATPSRSFASKDPLVEAVKSDLYIDPSKLHSTTWDDIAGLPDAKQALQEAAILPLMRPDLFSGLRRPRNILLYGPPGTGKTMLAKAVAYESSSALFVCTASAMTSKWHGEGEKLLKTLFSVAREAAPSIIFIDEVDALLSSRKSDGEHEASRRFKTEFMTNIDGIVNHGGDENGKHLLVIAATNCPWDIDSAVLRRFPRRIYIPLPDEDTRTALLESLLEKAGDTFMSTADVEAVVERLEGFSCSDIASIASEASFGPIRALGGISAIQAAKSSDIRPIQRCDFDNAIDEATKSVSNAILIRYHRWKQEQGAS